MLEQIRTALHDTSQKYSDTRICHCQMEVVSLEENHCTLTGAVLDSETRATVMADLTGRFPKITFHDDTVRVLRTHPSRLLAVSTNIASLYAKPTFMSEMVSQILNGVSVELLQEQGRWRFVRQKDGYLGWTYHAYLTTAPAPAPSHLVCAPVSLLYRAANLEAPLIGRLAGGTAVTVDEQADPWARLALTGGGDGWILRAELRALDAFPRGETAQRQQMVQDVTRFAGVPYLWGGCTGLGIDCSGLVKLLHHLAGQTIPRDADMQFSAGRPVEPPFQPGDLFFFSGESQTRSVTHVGMSLGGWRMVHSSIARNGVYEDDVQAVEHLRERFAGARTFLGLVHPR